MMQNSFESYPKSHESSQEDPTEIPNRDLVKVQGGKHNIMDDVNAAFVVLLNTFEYLTINDLIRASCVSKVWNYVASHDIFWKKIKLVSYPCDCNAFAQKLQKHGTKSLDMCQLRFDHRLLNRACPAPSLAGIFESLKRVDTVTKIKLGFCPPDVISVLAFSMPQLKSISMSCFSIEFDNIWLLKNLEELEIMFKSHYPFFPVFPLCNLKFLKTLKSLKILSFRKLDFIGQEIDNFPPGLESLVFGRCIRMPDNFPTFTIAAFMKLKRLRLEECHEGCFTTKIVTAISKLPNLSQLELINFQIEEGFKTALAKCTQLETLFIIPLYKEFQTCSKAHQIVIEGAIKLKETLKKFILGYCLKLLRHVDTFHVEMIHYEHCRGKVITATFIRQKINCESFRRDTSDTEATSFNLFDNEMLKKCLPKTKVKILEIPFSKIWDQTVQGCDF